jgi:hypothetical protein
MVKVFLWSVATVIRAGVIVRPAAGCAATVAADAPEAATTAICCRLGYDVA